MLYIIRGLPGSGKSTFAETLAGALKAPHYEEDMWLYSTGEYKWTPQAFANAVDMCLAYTELAMLGGNYDNIVVSNVFETEEQLKPYIEIAKRHGHEVTFLVAENRRGGVNIHNVPEEALVQMREDFEVSL